MDASYEIVDSNYGKNGVKMLHVQRDGAVHTIREWEVCVALTLDSHQEYLHADNRDVVATDTQKNTVYVLAKNHGLSSPERFALLLCEHFLTRYKQVVGVNISIEAHPWQRMQVNGEPHEHAFITQRETVRTCHAKQLRGEAAVVHAGITGMQVLKTTQSSFVDFHQDEFRSLPDQPDRIFSTVVQARWRYDLLDGVDFDKAWQKVREIILFVFAGPAHGGVPSPSVQETLYKSEVQVLETLPAVGEIEMVLPNKHYFVVDLSKLSKVVASPHNDEVFLPSDSPSGNIRAVVARRARSKL